ncbi:MAG: HemK family protein methyltransferase [Patescibacteria group bacterium]|nr:HemK family protein methyltransferase [Patescibacteria group bacterium]
MPDYIKEIGWIKSEKYHNRKSKELEKDIKRLKRGEPVDYIIGFKEFLGAKIDLLYRPLIPRLETEYWVEKVIESLRPYAIGHKPYTIPHPPATSSFRDGGRGKPICILDIFAGSGCIGIALLRALPFYKVDFAEKNTKFIKQIQKNLKINKIKTDRYNVIKSNIFGKIYKKYDYIFANPPYVSLKNNAAVEKTVLDWEPKSAVFANDKGLFYIKKFLFDAPKYLKKNGLIYIEFDAGQKQEIKQICQKIGYEKVIFYRDQFRRWRYLRAEI